MHIFNQIDKLIIHFQLLVHNMAQSNPNETTHRVQEENKMLKDKLERANQQIKLLAVTNAHHFPSPSLCKRTKSDCLYMLCIERQCFKLCTRT